MRFSWTAFFLVPWVSAAIVSTGVGSVQGKVITSREVQIQNLLESALNGDHKEKLKILALDSKAFAEEVQDTLLEAVVSLEAQNFNVMALSNEEVKSAERKANKILKKSEVASKELDAALRRKLQSKKFIQFRAQSSVIPVTDVEAQKYFNENRLKFGNLPFENLKENIKSALSRTQVERRLKDWYDVLLNKYQVKNLIAEI
jgi:folate-dependent tRNA-U54 methylase TrmFO/GidA